MMIQPYMPRFAAHLPERERRRKEQDELAGRLRETMDQAGIDRDTLARDWGVTLWTAVLDRKNALFFVDAVDGREVDLPALKEWLRERLADSGISTITLMQQPRDGCCGTGCYGCLNSNPQARRDWIA